MSIDKSMVVGLQMEMIKRFGTNTLRRGWNAHQTGQVLRVTKRDERLFAEVRDRHETCRVMIDLSKFDSSSCSCSMKRYCYHMAAVFFHVYAEHEKRTELFLMQHQQMRLLRSKERENRKKRSSKEKKEQSALWDSERSTVRESDSIIRWQLDLDKKFSGYFTAPVHQVESFHAEGEKYMLRVSEHWQSPNREMYHAVVQLFMLVLAENRYAAMMDSYKPTPLQESFRRLFELCTNGFLTRMEAIRLTSGDQASHMKLRELADWLHKHVFRTGDTPVRWLDVYRAFCWRLNEWSADMIRSEREWLTFELRDGALSADKQRKLKLGLLHHEIMESGAAAFAKLLEDVAEIEDISHCFAYVEHCVRDKDWLAARDLLGNMLPAVRDHISKSVIRRYLEMWEIVEKHVDCSEERQEVLRSLLPYSLEPYEKYLEQAGDYRLWVDLQMSADRTVNEMNRSMMMAIEQHEPALLLPLYHQSIDRYIAEKKRESYKLAVLLLKNLHAYYNRIDQPDRFKTYLGRLTDKYKMLRAFQEELKRSNLIS